MRLLSYTKKVIGIILFYLLGGSRAARFMGARVGKNCRIYTMSFGSEPFLIEIGNRVTLTSGVRILTHDGATWLMRDTNGRRFLYQKVTVGNNVFIGINSIIMPGVIIEDNVIVAAGSVITKSIPSGSIVAGNPAKIIGEYVNLKNKALSEYASENDVSWKQAYKERVLESLSLSTKRFMGNNE